MKTICLVMDINDLNWLEPYCKSQSADVDIVIVAPTFEGQLVAESCGLPFKSYEEVCWGIDINAVFKLAREKAHNWYRTEEIKNNPSIRFVMDYAGYPLFVMHESRVLLALFEIIYAFELITRIIEIEKPDDILFGDRENPFVQHVIFMLTGSNGVEREVVKALKAPFSKDPSFISSRINDLAPRQNLVKLSTQHPDSFVWSQGNGPKVLLFHYGGCYYLEFLIDTLAILKEKGAQIGIINIGEALTPVETRLLEEMGISCVDKAAWHNAGELMLLHEWQSRAVPAAAFIYSSETLQQFFSDTKGSYFQGLASDSICKEILHSSRTIIDLIRTESILKALKPDVVINHFATHPDEICDVLPARKLGIPTITMEHGVDGYLHAMRDDFATDFYAVNGRCYKEALVKVTGALPEHVHIIGNTRYDRNIEKRNVAQIKQDLGLDPSASLCIFCDNSVIPINIEYRHKTARIIHEVINLKRQLPELQIIYRAHHGGNYSLIRQYFQQYSDLGIIFQTSLDIPLLDIVQAADVVVANCSSAVTESLLSDVPVIYLHALAIPEPSYFSCPVITPTDSYEKLPDLVKTAINNPYAPGEVSCLAQPFFDFVLNGNDGKASERLAELILKAATISGGNPKTGFQDWFDHLDASCRFNPKEFLKYIPSDKTSNSDQPSVSIIIPSYNRDKMIGITLESFVNQDYPREKYEIIVADNRSTDNTRAVVLDWQNKSPIPIRYIYEERQGVHYARNSAAKQANGEILYFTDDDMIAEPDLLSELIKIFKQDPEVGTATGKVLPKWEVEPPEWIALLCNNFYLSLNDLGEECIVADHDIGVFSCHQAVTREAFFRAGGFNPDFFGADLLGDGETGLNIKLKEFGYKFGYNGKSVIHHMIPPARMTQDYLNKRLANQGGADCYTDYKRHRFSSDQLADRVQSYLTSLIEKSSLCTEKRMNGDIRWRMDKAYTHYYLSRIEYDLRLMKDPDWRELVLKDDWIDE